MLKKLCRDTGLALLLALLAPVGASAQGSDGDPSAAFIYVGPVGDAGWTYRHDQGRQCLEADGIKTAYVESVPQNQDVATVERDFIAEGFDVIFATAFGYQPFTQEVANENPDLHFFGITPTIAPADNILNYYGKLWDGRYLTGLVAGAMTQSNIVGFVAAHPIPTVLSNGDDTSKSPDNRIFSDAKPVASILCGDDRCFGSN